MATKKIAKTKKLRIFMIGTDSHPATEDDLTSFANAMKKAIEEGTSVVTHHAVNYFEIDL